MRTLACLPACLIALSLIHSRTPNLVPVYAYTLNLITANFNFNPKLHLAYVLLVHAVCSGYFFHCIVIRILKAEIFTVRLWLIIIYGFGFKVFAVHKIKCTEVYSRIFCISQIVFIKHSVHFIEIYREKNERW